MNPDRYSCNVVIAGLMAQLCLPEGKPSVAVFFWEPDEIDFEFRYGSGVFAFRDIKNLSVQSKDLGTAREGWVTYFFAKSKRLLYVSLI